VDPDKKKDMKRKIIRFVLGVMLLGLSFAVEAQQPKVYRIGVLLPGDAWYETVDGLRAGLKELGLEERKHFTLAIRDTK